MATVNDKIKKILAMIDGATTEGEARAASLALQRLLVLYHVFMSVTTNAKRGKPDPQSDFPLLTRDISNARALCFVA